MQSHITQHYRDYLGNALAGRGGLSIAAISKQLSAFDTAVKAGSDPKQVFEYLLDTYGNEDTALAMSTIESELTKLNEQHEGIDTNSVTRLRAYLDKHRSNLGKCAAEISDGSGGTKTIVGDPKSVQDPGFLPSRSQTYTHEATAQYQGKPVKLALEIC